MSSVESDGQHVYCREYAVSLDAQDPLSHIRNEFFIPTRAQLKAQSLPEAGKKYRLNKTSFTKRI